MLYIVNTIIYKILTLEKVDTKCSCEYIKNTAQANT